jgi:hypothetical protein
MSRLKSLVKGAWAAALPLLALGWLLFGGAGALRAQSGNQAGLVVVLGDGRVITRCVTFEEDAISGLTLLQRAGLSLETSAGAGGATICSIAGEGCPASDCFCQCKGAPCIYWNYFYRDQGGPWTYAALGALGRQVRPGDVDGWVWGDGSSPPPDVDLAAICAADALPAQPPATATLTPVVASPTPMPTATPEPPVATLTPTGTATATIPTTVAGETTSTPTSVSATATATATLTPTPTSPPTSVPPTSTPVPEIMPEPQAFPFQYLVYALLLIGLGGAFWYVRHRGR